MQEKILVIGDVMIDKYTFGEVKRLNPESPMPLINVTKEELRLGWSANVAANIASLNENCDLTWLVWNDENANLLEKLCNKLKINFTWIKVNNFKTILKHRFVENTYHQQLLRIDYEEKIENQKFWEKILEKIKKENYKIIVVSDYNKWIVFENWIEELKNFAKEKNILLLADSKPKNYELFKDFYLVKPNFKEFCEMIWKNLENKDEEIEKNWIDFTKKMNTNLVITRWAKWASLITKDWKYFHIPTEAQKVFDVSGAWDTFIATIAFALKENYDLKDAIKLANKASWIVVEKVWTAIVEKEELFNKKC